MNSSGVSILAKQIGNCVGPLGKWTRERKKERKREKERIVTRGYIGIRGEKKKRRQFFK